SISPGPSGPESKPFQKRGARHLHETGSCPALRWQENAPAILFLRKTPMNLSSRIGLPVLILLAIGASAWIVHGWPEGRALSVSLLLGAAFGIVLQRSRFCFLCNFRDLVEARDPRGVFSILVALAAGAVLYSLVMMAWAPVPQPGRLPPGAHIGPISPVLAVAALVFGLGMAISGSCLSAHLYRLGE